MTKSSGMVALFYAKQFVDECDMLRDYQKEICEKVNEAFEVHRSVMMQMPTGTGKTVVLASLVKQYLHADANSSVLIVAHRIELIEQTGAFLSHFGIDYGVIAGGKRPTVFKRVMVASVQTLSKNLDLSLSPSLVVIDEAHHALAKTYQQLWTTWPEAKFLGLTATPYRMSGEGFTDLFDVLVDSWSIKQFIADGWLSPYDYYSIRPDSEEQQKIDALKKRGADGDFQLKELREKLDVRPSIARLFESFERLALDKKGIIYAIDIAHAEHIAEYYRLQGVSAQAISSKTPPAVRRQLLSQFKEQQAPDHPNALQILVSVDLFSEGFDCPDVEFIQLARPTLSLTKYLQMVGRGLRPYRGKRCCTIIDNVGLYRSFGLPSADRDWCAYFLGNEELGIRNEELANGDAQFLWLGAGDLREEATCEILRIVSHEGMQSQFTSQSRTNFERRRKGKAWVWIDPTNGVAFDRPPKVINYRGLELTTADGQTFFPRIRSRWIDAKHGINRKTLETQVGAGIGWMKLYISLAQPDKVLQLQSVQPNQARIYKDEQGAVLLQQDLDHMPIPEEAAGGRKAFMVLCNSDQNVWEAMKRNNRQHTLKYDAAQNSWQLPTGAIKQPMDAASAALHLASRQSAEGQPLDNEHAPSLYHIIYKENGEQKEFWMDEASGLTYRHRPVLRKRGFVDLLYDGDVVYILNIQEERFMPYRNWEIRADEHICTIGNKLYLSLQRNDSSYRIKKRSDDFRMFVVEERTANDNPHAIEYDEYLIINEAGKQPEIT